MQPDAISDATFPFFLDLGEQPGFDRGGCPLSLRIVMGKPAGLKDYGAQLGGTAAMGVVEVHERKAASRGIASCRSAITGAVGRRCLRLRCRRAPTRQCPPFPSS